MSDHVPAGHQITTCRNPDGSLDRVLVFVGDGTNVYIAEVLEQLEPPRTADAKEDSQ